MDYLNSNFFKPTLLAFLSILILHAETSSSIQQGTTSKSAFLISYPRGQEALYYGFFFPESTAVSIKTLSELYISACMREVPACKTFLDSRIFQKPLDPNTQLFDPYYHVTAKFCGESDCSGYLDQVEAQLNREFQMHLVGFYFTNRTFGVRIHLTPDQEALFDNSGRSNVNVKSQAEVRGHFPLQSQSLPGITLEDQPFSSSPTRNIAHITLGTAPGIPAVTTGTDLKQIIQMETSSNPSITNETSSVQFSSDTSNEPLSGTNFTLIFYNDTSSPSSQQGFGEAFVFYPSVKALAVAKFEPYLKPSGESRVKATGFLLAISLLVLISSIA